MTTYIRVRVRATGHQVDIVESHFNPDRHDLVKRAGVSKTPRRPKFRTAYQRAYKTSAPKAVEGTALPNEAGTENEGGEP